MNFLFDRNVPPNLPKALQRLRPPINILLHKDHFHHQAMDDAWLEVAGTNKWIVITQDYHFHLRENERFAIQQHRVGCFYLWGASAPIWEITRHFMRSYDAMIKAAEATDAPFVFRMERRGRLVRIPLD